MQFIFLKDLACSFENSFKGVCGRGGSQGVWLEGSCRQSGKGQWGFKHRWKQWARPCVVYNTSDLHGHPCLSYYGNLHPQASLVCQLFAAFFITFVSDVGQHLVSRRINFNIFSFLFPTLARAYPWEGSLVLQHCMSSRIVKT